VLLPAPDERPAFNELSRSGPSFPLGNKTLKMKDKMRILAKGDSNIGRRQLHKLKAKLPLCLFYERN
jgi:hypothetical protein